jgi:hypothetical protein
MRYFLTRKLFLRAAISLNAKRRSARYHSKATLEEGSLPAQSGHKFESLGTSDKEALRQRHANEGNSQ